MEQELLAAIERDPEDPAPYLVYADWLQGRGDLRGELMTLQNATEDRPGDHRISDAALDHVRAHAEYYLGELAPLVDEPRSLKLGWRCGFIASAISTSYRPWLQGRFEMSAERVLATLLQLPSARFLTRLVAEPTNMIDARFIAQAIAAYAPASLRELWIGPRDPQSALRDCELGELGGWERFPQLRELRLHGDIERLDRLRLPALRSATIMLAGSARALRVMDDLIAADWPNLERLHLWNAPLLATVEQLLEREHVLLGDLGIINCAFADPVCRVIARSPIAAQLYRLSLARGTLTDAGVEVLVEQRARFPSLATIDVSETFVTAAGVSRLRTMAREVVANDRRTGPPQVLIPQLLRDPDD